MNIAVCAALCLLLSLTVVVACLIIPQNKQISLISAFLFYFFFLGFFSFLFTYGEFLWKALFLEGDKFFNLLGAFI